MKKVLIFLAISFSVLLILYSFCDAGVTANFGMSFIDSKSDSISMRAEAKGNWRNNEVEFELYHYTHRSRTDNLIDMDRRLSELQVNYYLSQLPVSVNKNQSQSGMETMIFTGGWSQFDYQMNRNEIAGGGGVGFNYVSDRLSLRLQGGPYMVDQYYDQTCILNIVGNSTINLTENGKVQFVPVVKLNRDLERHIWKTAVDAKLRFRSNDRISLVFGFERYYDGLCGDTTKNIYTSVELNI